MSNLLKAEWYRLRHSGMILPMLIFAQIVFVLFSFTSGTLEFSFLSFTETAPMAVSFALIGVTVVTTDPYNTRMAFYEIMNGTSAHKIVLCKFIMALTLMTCLYFIPVCAILFICDGEVMTVGIVLQLFMCIAKLTVFFVSICMILKSPIAVIIPTMLYELEYMPFAILSNEFDVDMSAFMPWFTTSQFTLMGYDTLSSGLFASPVSTEHLMLKIFISFVVVIGVMYTLAYMSVKKKWNISLRFN